jgi:hypothetical protein
MLYLLTQGEVTFFKRPEQLYVESNKRIKIENIELMVNPKRTCLEKLGLPIGSIKGPSLLNEDVVVFKDSPIYSLVTKTRCLVFSVSASNTGLPTECVKALQVQTMDKFSNFNNQVLQLESQLSQSKERLLLA